MADTNRNQWEERYQSGWQQNRDNGNNQFDRTRDDYSSNYGNNQDGSRYGGEDYRSDSSYRSNNNNSYDRRNERRDDYSSLDKNRDRSSNMGSGYDPYHYGQTIGSFNQGKDGSYDSRFNNDGYKGDRNYINRDSGYDSDYNRSYGRRNLDNYGSGSGYRERYENKNEPGRSWNNDDYGNKNASNRDWWDRTTDEVASWFGDDDAQRRREADKRTGPHRGKGPKGYKRSDERIKDDVNDRLSDDSFIDASEIDVTCEDCEIVLTGTVDSKEEKRRAEDIAERVSGVKNVENRLKVRSKDSTSGATIYKNRD